MNFKFVKNILHVTLSATAVTQISCATKGAQTNVAPRKNSNLRSIFEQAIQNLHPRVPFKVQTSAENRSDSYTAQFSVKAKKS